MSNITSRSIPIPPAGWWHAHFQRIDEILIQSLGFQITGSLSCLLGFQPFLLINRIDELTEGIGRFTADDEQLKAFHKPRLAPVFARQGGDFDRVIDHECRP